MADFRHLVTLCLELERTPARLEKLRLVAGFLRALPAEDVATAVLFLTGRAFPPADPRALGIRWLPSADEPTAGPPLIFADVGEALAAHRGRSALEFKYDGARIQLHRDGDGVAVWTRRLSDVTRSLPDVVAIARRDLGHAPFILDGEVLALDPAGRPLPFQELMRRFRRVHGVDALVREMPLALYFFDCLMADGRSVIDEPYERRWEAPAAVTGGRSPAAPSG